MGCKTPAPLFPVLLLRWCCCPAALARETESMRSNEFGKGCTNASIYPFIHLPWSAAAAACSRADRRTPPLLPLLLRLPPPVCGAGLVASSVTAAFASPPPLVAVEVLLRRRCRALDVAAGAGMFSVYVSVRGDGGGLHVTRGYVCQTVHGSHRPRGGDVVCLRLGRDWLRRQRPIASSFPCKAMPSTALSTRTYRLFACSTQSTAS